METHPRGFKFRTIIDRFAWDILLILRESLAEKSFDSDHIKLRILMTLSDVSENSVKTDSEFKSRARPRPRHNSYVKDLLFRDFSAEKVAIWHSFDLPATDKDHARTVHIHDEAITYLSGVLGRRLTLAQNLKEKPTNLHLLFTSLSHYSRCHPDWKTAQAYRHRDYYPTNEGRSYFCNCAQKLAEQRTTLSSNFNDISHRRRKQYGPLWLVVEDCIAELPEEFSLFDVFNALPLALYPEFINNSEIQKYLVRVLDSLNERYKLLRSTGLTPHTWLDRADPSIAILRDLKQIRTDANEFLRTGESNNVASAFCMAFDRKIADEGRKKLAGCRNFDEFLQREYGMAMLKYSAISLDQSEVTDSEGDYRLHEAIPGLDFEEAMVQSIFTRFGDDFDWIQYLIDSKPELFDEITTIFFKQAIGLDRPLDGTSSDQPLLKNPKFKKLINAHPRYKHLDAEELADHLIEQAHKIIDQGIRLCTEASDFSMVTEGE